MTSSNVVGASDVCSVVVASDMSLVRYVCKSVDVMSYVEVLSINIVNNSVDDVYSLVPSVAVAIFVGPNVSFVCPSYVEAVVALPGSVVRVTVEGAVSIVSICVVTVVVSPAIEREEKGTKRLIVAKNDNVRVVMCSTESI